MYTNNGYSKDRQSEKELIVKDHFFVQYENILYSYRKRKKCMYK